VPGPLEHRAEQGDQDVGDGEVAADVPELGAVDHRHDRAAHVGGHLLQGGGDRLLVGVPERVPHLRVLVGGPRIGY
jgi:hypothetical protein